MNRTKIKNKSLTNFCYKKLFVRRKKTIIRFKTFIHKNEKEEEKYFRCLRVKNHTKNHQMEVIVTWLVKWPIRDEKKNRPKTQ